MIWFWHVLSLIYLQFQILIKTVIDNRFLKFYSTFVHVLLTSNQWTSFLSGRIRWYVRWIYTMNVYSTSLSFPSLSLSLSLSCFYSLETWRIDLSSGISTSPRQQCLFACHEKWTDHVGSYATRLWNSYWCLILDDGAALQDGLSLWYTWLCSKATSSFTKCRCVRITCDGCCFMTYIIPWAMN